MTRLLRKTTALLLLLSYFFFGSTPAQALLWCQEADGYTHLEFNLAGSCELSCVGEEKFHPDEATAPGGPSLASPADQCSDTTLALQQLRSEPGHPEPGQQLLPALPSATSATLRPQAALFQPAKPAPAPPPSPQYLVALRTIVLRN
ncbi:hypothetical protein DESUT3_07570 [Desulfuromonas versatilis]|uniref:Secreted protein n=1 Tax=Desulfuromonas versatilis TaxID=2802975 RepID=A0ABN6DU94_9BACT|nr:hypothetical protein [Desulfuromonas versatilis]BCR03688.1 hypothetical protein DESUT3_07570 [Desulfuromonas versatilis]